MSSYEEALVALEERLEGAHKVASDLVKAVRRAQTAARTGHARDIERRLDDIRDRISEAAPAFRALDGAWSFDVGGYMAGGDYLAELQEASAEIDLELFERDGKIYSFPLLIQLEPKEGAVRVGRKVERRVRPGVLAKALARARGRPQRFNEQRFLELLYKAYRRVDRGSGHAVALAELHESLTLFPGTGYPVEEFARDLLLLDRQPDLRTRDNCRFELPKSTTSKGRRRIVVYDEEGNERLYVGIRFVKAD